MKKNTQKLNLRVHKRAMKAAKRKVANKKNKYLRSIGIYNEK